MDSIEEILEEIQRTKIFGWDLEAKSKTDNPRDAVIPHKAEVTHIALASLTKSACWDISPESMAALVSCLENEDYYGVVFNAPYDHALLHFEGHINHKNIRCKLLDGLGLVYLVDEEDQHGLKHSALKFCRIKMTTFDEVVKLSAPAQKLREIERQHGEYSKLLTKWESKSPKRPYPDWDSPALSRTAIRKSLREANPELRPKDAQAQAEELFTEDYLEQYRAWVDKKKVKDDAKLVKLRVRINEHMKKYARGDAATLIKLLQKVMKIINEEGTAHVIPVEMETQLEVIDMHIRGVNLDKEKLLDLQERMTTLSDQFEQEIYNVAKGEFNIDSPKQLREVLFEQLGITPPSVKIFKTAAGERHVPAFTKGGETWIKEQIEEGAEGYDSLDSRVPESFPEGSRNFLACDVKTLERIEHPIAQAILNYRVVSKLLGTYVTSSLATLELWGDGKIHPRFKNFATVTNRFACVDPNAQTLPGKGKGDMYHPDVQTIGMEIRDAFIPPPADELAPEGYGFIQCDLSQIELRVGAHVTQDKGLNRVYNEHIVYRNVKFFTGDIHANTSNIIGCSRKGAKASNFGSAYGVGPDKFARMNSLFIPGTDEYDIELASTLIEGFFKAYPGVRKTMNDCERLYRGGQRLFPTIAGRWRHFYDADRGKGFKPAKGKIYNSIIQGSAGDILKYAMFIIRKYLYPLYPGARMVLQIHDELIIACPLRYIKEVAILVKYIMEFPWYPLSVPILSGAKICTRWGDAGKDSVPEVGVFYAKVNGVDRLFTDKNWDEFLEHDEAGNVEAKASGAQLTPLQHKWAASKIPKHLPPSRPDPAGKKIMTRAERLAAGIK